MASDINLVFYSSTITLMQGPINKIHSLSVIKTSQLMQYMEIIAVCSEIHTKHINLPRRQNVGI